MCGETMVKIKQKQTKIVPMRKKRK